MYALVNLFIYILQNPRHPRVQSDLALLDVGAGHFARLQIAMDSEVSVDFVKEMATLARGASENPYWNYSDPKCVDSDPANLRVSHEMTGSSSDQILLGPAVHVSDMTAVSHFPSFAPYLCPLLVFRGRLHEPLSDYIAFSGLYESSFRSRAGKLVYLSADWL